jgi:hypothetical protein
MINIIPPPVDVPDGAGFSNEIDILKRKTFGEALTRLVQAIPDGGAVALDSPWGEGKTTFVKMWRGYLHQQNIKSIYFDAFEHDYSDDPFICLSAELLTFFESVGAEEQTLKDKMASVGKGVLKAGLSLGLKVLTLNAVDGTALENVGADIAQELSTITDKQILDRIQTQKNLKQNIQDFRDRLVQVVQDHAGGTLVFVIDELDRCRPDFAVAMIEQVKHLFAARGVVFVLVLNSKQMQEYVRGVYGVSIEDAERYLQKFINIWASLPPKEGRGEAPEYRAVIRNFVGRTGLRESGAHEVDVIEKHLNDLANRYSLSLRDIEKTMTYVAMLYAVLGDRSHKETRSIALLAVMKVIRPKLFNGLMQGEINSDQALKGMNMQVNKDEHDDFFAIILVFLASHKNDWIELMSKIQQTNEKGFIRWNQVDQLFEWDNGWDYMRRYTKAMSTFTAT